jgi:hypothetical protein
LWECLISLPRSRARESRLPNSPECRGGHIRPPLPTHRNVISPLFATASQIFNLTILRCCPALTRPKTLSLAWLNRIINQNLFQKLKRIADCVRFGRDFSRSQRDKRIEVTNTLSAGSIGAQTARQAGHADETNAVRSVSPHNATRIVKFTCPEKSTLR